MVRAVAAVTVVVADVEQGISPVGDSEGKRAWTSKTSSVTQSIVFSCRRFFLLIMSYMQLEQSYDRHKRQLRCHKRLKSVFVCESTADCIDTAAQLRTTTPTEADCPSSPRSKAAHRFARGTSCCKCPRKEGRICPSACWREKSVGDKEQKSKGLGQRGAREIRGWCIA